MAKFIQITIKIKIFLLVFSLVITVTFALSFSFLHSFKNLIVSEFEEKGRLIVKDFASDIDTDILKGDINNINKTIFNITDLQDIIFVNVYHKDGYPLSFYKNNLFPASFTKATELSIKNYTVGPKNIPVLDFISPVFNLKYGYIGCVRIVMSLERVNTDILNLIFRVFLWIIVAFSLIGGIGSYLIGYKIAAPIDLLTHVIAGIVGEGGENKIVEAIKSGYLMRDPRIYSRDEVGRLAIAFYQIMELLKNNLSKLETEIADRKQAEELVRKSNEELELRVLERTRKLEEAQEQIILSEKMAALGQLIAGIAHEINTPLGAIRSSISNVSKTLQQTIKELPVLFQLLSTEDTDLFFSLIERSLQNTEMKTSIEEREIRTHLTEQLTKAGCTDAASFADTLVDMRIYDQLENFLPLLNNAHGGNILNIAYRLTGLQRNTVTIVTATERAARIVNALKNYVYQNDQDRKVLVNISEELETVLTLYHNKIKHDVEIVRQYAQVPEIMCYRDELNQVWTNLVTNALQAIEFKGRLELKIFSENGNVVIQITDNGTGIPDELKSKIFNPFFTTKKKGEGAGLGLSIVKKIIEKHKGKIEFESQVAAPGIPGQTTFTVTLPITDLKPVA